MGPLFETRVAWVPANDPCLRHAGAGNARIYARPTGKGQATRVKLGKQLRRKNIAGCLARTR